MRARGFRDTRRRSPRRNFPNGSRRPPASPRFTGSHPLEPERSRGVSPVRRTERDDDQSSRYCEDRSSNIIIAEYSKSVARGESASLKFRWNNLLDAKQRLENAPSSTTTKNPVVSGGFGYGIGTVPEKREGFPDSGMVPIGAPRNYNRHVGGGFVSPLGKNEVSLPNKSELQMPRHQHQYQHQHQQHHQQQQYGVSLSQSNASSSSSSCANLLVNLPRSSIGLSRSVGISGDGYFAEDVHVQMPKKSNSVDYGRVQQCPVPVMNRDFNYSEVQRSEKSDDDVLRYRNVTATTLQGEFRHQEFRRPSIVDSIVDRIDGIQSSNGDPLRKGAPWEENLSSDEHLTPKYRDLTQPSKRCVELLGCRNMSMHPEYGTEGYRDSEGWSLKDYGKHAYATNYQDSSKGLPVLDHDQYFYKHEGISEEDGMSKTEELAIHDLDVEMFEFSGITNENQVWTDSNDGLPHRQCASDTFDDEEISFDEDIMHVQFDGRSTSPYSPVPAAKRNSRKQEVIIGKSMKKKPRPAWTIHLPNSLVSSFRNVHARLGPRVVVPTENPYAGKNVKNKKVKRNPHDFSKTAPCSDLSEVKVKVKHSKTEPPEDSKEFKQLVQNAFFKFVKLLNDNPAQRKKYTDQGGNDTLRCTLCGRSVIFCTMCFQKGVLFIELNLLLLMLLTIE